MARSGGKDKDRGGELKLVCRNRRASFEYELAERIECGIVLVGTEVKSLRDGQASLENAYAKVEDGEVWLYEAEIPEYAMGNRLNHKPKRPRKLLLHRREIGRFAGRAGQKGFTLVPTALYFKGGRAKVEIAVGAGKQLHDKRQSLKKADAQREIQQAMRRRRD